MDDLCGDDNLNADVEDPVKRRAAKIASLHANMKRLLEIQDDSKISEVNLTENIKEPSIQESPSGRKLNT